VALPQCFRELAALVEEQQHAIVVAAEKEHEQAVAEAAAAKARQEAAAKLAAEQAKQQALAQEAAAREAAKPENRLRRAYQLYAMVKFCNATRVGYLTTSIDDVELERADIVVKQIERNVSGDTDALWQQALANVKGTYATHANCRSALSALMDMYGDTTDLYGVEKR
jgi:hypothetical protein